MSCVWMLQRGHSGDGCVLASTLCKYDLRKGDLFVMSWASVEVCCVFVGDVMDVVFSVCIVRRGAVGARVCGV